MRYTCAAVVAVVGLLLALAGCGDQRRSSCVHRDSSGPPAYLHEIDYGCQRRGLTALPFANGRARLDQLSRIAYPEGYAYLRSGSPAAAWNTMNVCATRDGVQLLPLRSSYSPAATAYRSYEVQVILRRQLGTNAAVPGTSNHGAGQAIDLRDGGTGSMRAWINAHGGAFGFEKRTSDAPWEPWHIAAAGVALTWTSPDPGSDAHFPNLQVGSRGLCLAGYVKRVQRAVGIPTTARFGGKTRDAVIRWKAAHGLHPDARITSRAWRLIP